MGFLRGGVGLITGRSYFRSWEAIFCEFVCVWVCVIMRCCMFYSCFGMFYKPFDVFVCVSGILDPGSSIQDPGSGIQDPGFGIL